jgi:hypothetical protein
MAVEQVIRKNLDNLLKTEKGKMQQYQINEA